MCLYFFENSFMWKIHVHVQIFSYEINLYGKFLFSVHHLYGFIGSTASLTYFKSFAFVFPYEICFIWNLAIFIFYLKKLSYEIFFFDFCIFFRFKWKWSLFLSHPKVVLSHVSNKTLWCYFLQNDFLTNWRGVLESNNKADFGNLFWGKF